MCKKNAYLFRFGFLRVEYGGADSVVVVGVVAQLARHQRHRVLVGHQLMRMKYCELGQSPSDNNSHQVTFNSFTNIRYKRFY